MARKRQEGSGSQRPGSLAGVRVGPQRRPRRGDRSQETRGVRAGAGWRRGRQRFDQRRSPHPRIKVLLENGDEVPTASFRASSTLSITSSINLLMDGVTVVNIKKNTLDNHILVGLKA